MTNKVTHWTIDKKVPVAILVMIAFQTLSVIWFAAKLEARVERHDELLLDIAGDVKDISHAQRLLAEKQIRTETILQSRGQGG